MALAVAPVSSPTLANSGVPGTGFIPFSNVAEASASTPQSLQESPLPSGAVTAATPAASGTTTSTTTNPADQAEYEGQLSADQAAINSGISTSAGDYNQSILDLVNGNTNAQAKINADAVQNELARDQGLQGVTDMVGNGIQGGGVQIDDAGGGTSSAGQQLAQDYGIVGRQAASQVGNQYAQGVNTVGNEQTVQNNDEATQIGDEQQKKSDTINSIVTSANSSLQYLDSLAQSADITDLPSINQQIATVKAQATAALSAYDGELSGINVAPTSQDQNRATAQQLVTAGTAPSAPFQFTTTQPAQFANSGPSPSTLPIYIAPSTSNKNNDSVLLG